MSGKSYSKDPHNATMALPQLLSRTTSKGCKKSGGEPALLTKLLKTKKAWE